VGFGAFEKMKCIFSIALVESLEKSRDSPDARPNALFASGEWYSLGCTH